MSFPFRLALALSVGLSALITTPAVVTAQRPIAPFKAGDRYFFVGSDSALYVRDNRNAAPRQLLPAGTFGTVAASPNGDYIAYAVPSPTDAYQVRIRDVRSARDINEVLPHARISRLPWSRNSRGFAYVRVDSVDHHERIYYHKMGEPSARDQILYSRLDEPDWKYSIRVSDDGQFGIITITHPVDANTRLYFIDFDNPNKPSLGAPVVKLVDEFSARYNFIDNGGNTFFLLTNRNAPLGEVVMANTETTRQSRWQSVIRQSAETLTTVVTAGEQYVVAFSRDTANKSAGRVYAPPSAKEMRAAYQKHLDSLTKADRKQNPNRMGPPPGAMSDFTAFKLGLKASITVPNGTVVDVTSNANDDEMFYTVKQTDGTFQSFLYNVKSQRGVPFNTTVASTTNSASTAR